MSDSYSLMHPKFSQYYADILGATVGSFAAAPMITAVDRAIANSVSGNAKLIPEFVAGLKDCMNRKFYTSKPFFWIWGLYAGTYIASNCSMTYARRAQLKDPEFVQWATTSFVNTTACIAKDVAFAKHYRTKAADGVQQAAKKIGMDSIGAWVLRDCVAMFFFITLPGIAARAAHEIIPNERAAEYTAQLIVPLSSAFILTPLNMWGYRLYNYEGADRHQFKATYDFLKQDYLKNVAVKFIRIIPSWTLGVLINNEIKRSVGRTLAKFE